MTTQSTSQTPTLDDAALEAWCGFLRVHQEQVRALDRHLLGAHGIVLSEYEVLAALASTTDGLLRMTALADAVLLTRSGVADSSTDSPGQDLATREPCPGDARGLYAAITPPGRTRLAEARLTMVRHVHHHFVAHVHQDDLHTLTNIWTQIPPPATARRTR